MEVAFLSPANIVQQDDHIFGHATRTVQDLGVIGVPAALVNDARIGSRRSTAVAYASIVEDKDGVFRGATEVCYLERPRKGRAVQPDDDVCLSVPV